MRVYLEGIIRRVEENGHAITKPLDGVLIKIALEQLRERFKDKYYETKVIVEDLAKKVREET